MEGTAPHDPKPADEQQQPQHVAPQPMHHEAVAKAHAALTGPMSVHELHHQAAQQPDAMGQPTQVIASTGLDMMRAHPLAYPGSQGVSMFPSHPVSMAAVIPTPNPMQGVAMDNQQLGRNHVIGALQLFEQEFDITVDEHNDTSCFTSAETKGNHSSVILDKILACAPIRQRLNLIPVPVELYSQAVQLFRAKGRLVFSSHLEPQDKKQGARVASYVCNACNRHHGITSAIRHCIRSLRAEIKHDEIDWSTWSPCPWTVFGRDFIKACLRPVPRLITNKRPSDGSRRSSGKMSKHYYNDDETFESPLTDDLVDMLKRPLSLESSQAQDGSHNPAQLQMEMMDRLNALSSAVLTINDAMDGLRRSYPKQDLYAGHMHQGQGPQLLSVTSLSQVDPQALAQPNMQPQGQQLQLQQPLQQPQLQQAQLQQPQVMAVSTASMVASGLVQQANNTGM
eukprot:m.190917 g.190917  ORF g.190917 m.190917 type:complete len:452 (+) comp16952_c0_seq10:3527-4882(+)